MFSACQKRKGSATRNEGHNDDHIFEVKKLEFEAVLMSTPIDAAIRKPFASSQLVEKISAFSDHHDSRWEDETYMDVHNQ